MTEKTKFVSNPLTVIAIFAALAEVNATVSIGLVDKDLQQVFLWFVILFPTLLVVLFFLTLNYNTEVIYAPSDYKDDNSFHKALFGERKEPDKEINNDKEIIRKTLKDLGIEEKSNNEIKFKISDNVNYLFSVRYALEKELRRIASIYLKDERFKPVMAYLSQLVEENIITGSQHKALRNIYSISSPAIHGEEQRLTVAEIDFVKQVAPGLIEDLKEIK